MKKKPIVLATLIAGTLLLPIVGHAQGAGRFPDFVPFDAALLQFPEGVAVDKVGNVYASTLLSPVGPVPFLSDQLWKFSPSGTRSLLADFGPPGGGGCGLAVDAEGNVYFARNPVLPIGGTGSNGVYRVDRDGNIGLVSGTDQIGFPDALAFDQQGTLYVTEVVGVGPSGLLQGGIWRVPKGGTAELWLRSELLTGLAPTLFPYPAGANGIAFYRGNLYVNNTDKALVLRIPVLPDGRPGQLEVWQQVQDMLGDVPSPLAQAAMAFLPFMLDGLALDVHGNAYIAVPTRCAIIRINAADHSQQTIAVYPQVPLDAPLSLAFGTGDGERQSLFISNGGLAGVVLQGIPLAWPGPGIVRIDVTIPGLPLP